MLVARFAWVSIDTESSFHSPLGPLGRIKWPLHVSVYVCLCVWCVVKNESLPFRVLFNWLRLATN